MCWAIRSWEPTLHGKGMPWVSSNSTLEYGKLTALLNAVCSIKSSDLLVTINTCIGGVAIAFSIEAKSWLVQMQSLNKLLHLFLDRGSSSLEYLWIDDKREAIAIGSFL